MKRRARCRSCGGTRTIAAVDNFGASYVGCAVCVVRPLPVTVPDPAAVGMLLVEQ